MYLILSYLTFSQLSYLSFLLLNLNLPFLSYLLSTYISIYYPSTIYLTTYHLPPYCMPPPMYMCVVPQFPSHPFDRIIVPNNQNHQQSKPIQSQTWHRRKTWRLVELPFKILYVQISRSQNNFPGKKPLFLKMELKFLCFFFFSGTLLPRGNLLEAKTRTVGTWKRGSWSLGFWGIFGEILRCSKEEWLRPKGVTGHWDLID